ncbi:MAG TPA: hypothetical protein VND19_04635 [Acetobacteraceae bacterium]|nr:hypothetical protein [Acetobacteraceae bacterium]
MPDGTALFDTNILTASGDIPKIEMWAEGHLELLLAARPHLIAEFHLR